MEELRVEELGVVCLLISFEGRLEGRPFASWARLRAFPARGGGQGAARRKIGLNNVIQE